MNLTDATAYLKKRAEELGLPASIQARQPDHIGAVSFIAEITDGVTVELGRTVQDAEQAIKRLVGQEQLRPIHQQIAKASEPVATPKRRNK